MPRNIIFFFCFKQFTGLTVGKKSRSRQKFCTPRHEFCLFSIILPALHRREPIARNNPIHQYLLGSKQSFSVFYECRQNFCFCPVRYFLTRWTGKLFKTVTRKIFVLLDFIGWKSWIQGTKIGFNMLISISSTAYCLFLNIDTLNHTSTASICHLTKIIKNISFRHSNQDCQRRR